MQSSYGPTAESIVEVRNLIAANGNNAIAGYTAAVAPSARHAMGRPTSRWMTCTAARHRGLAR